ncbi:poly-beta-hydroxybutyrate polymerase [Iodidimonas muriae]|uniref:Poly-beta-hydroxybutyrate polymerase n=1 Tax=Iodidimonas muriae TaxID=261467 RepID=A0ABQ2LG84_9PROT|nr:alpha/beta fold hydrolase [Iodidimonas muriae]GER08474.1 poly-beta-hydroxybutyrate polymerase [Kordiimonadales bacterium JCM 17843]GGO16787.1 poly-beta-hydroxybutyrate polymerase [Iodidimonas muriae]
MTDADKPKNGAADKQQARKVKPLAAALTAICDDRVPPGHYTAQAIDRAFKANLARLTNGLSPAGLADLYFNWLAHLSLSPGKHAELAEKASRKLARLMLFAGQSGANPEVPPCIEPLPQDRRFAGKEWQQWPYNLIYQSFLLSQQWWYNATTDIDGLSDKDEQVISFVARQLLDLYAPSNFIWTNPEILKATIEQGGMNLIKGAQNLAADWQRGMAGKKPVGTDDYQVGQNIAVTPGKVVYRNHLIELIQYTPTTDKVYPEPILVVPAWIMKYYILDLSPHNSLVKYLVDQGHTVFMISWRNPTSEDRNLGMEDYRRLGVMDVLDAVSSIVPDRKVHAVGYCLGGTLLSIAAAAMARDGDDRLATITTLATQVDFTEAGELMLFIRESEVSYLENMMWDRGFLDGSQMAGAFQILRSNDLIWSRLAHEYLLGKRAGMNDLMAWNADLTRMPYKMHSEYLRGLFLNNDLASGRFMVEGRPINLADIRTPIFAVGTVKDHVAPWRSVHKITFHPATDVTFLLTSGGHNAGIVSEPGHPRRNYQVATKHAGETYIDPDTWHAQTPYKDGSWWPEWQAWLAGHSTGPVAPPPMGTPGKRYAPICDAPGTYVFQE